MQTRIAALLFLAAASGPRVAAMPTDSYDGQDVTVEVAMDQPVWAYEAASHAYVPRADAGLALSFNYFPHAGLSGPAGGGVPYWIFDYSGRIEADRGYVQVITTTGTATSAVRSRQFVLSYQNNAAGQPLGLAEGEVDIVCLSFGLVPSETPVASFYFAPWVLSGLDWASGELLGAWSDPGAALLDTPLNLVRGLGPDGAALFGRISATTLAMSSPTIPEPATSAGALGVIGFALATLWRQRSRTKRSEFSRDPRTQPSS